MNPLRDTPEAARRVVELLREGGPLAVGDVLLAFPPARRPFVRMSLAWMAKLGVGDRLPAL